MSSTRCINQVVEGSSVATTLDDYLAEASKPSAKEFLGDIETWSLTALQGLWRKLKIGPPLDKPKDVESAVDDIMSELYGDNWLRQVL